MAPEYVFWLRIGFSARHSLICIALSIARKGPPATTLFIIQGNKRCRRLEKDIAACHMTTADEGPDLGFAGRVHEAL